MNRPIDMSPPWWDGNIAIPFSHEQWKYIAEVLNGDLVYHYGLITQEAVIMARNIIDVIEKNLGEE